MVSNRGTGQYRATLVHRGGHGRLYHRQARKGVILIAGWTGTADNFYTAGVDQLTLITPILDARFPTAAVGEDSQWGNSEARARITDIRTFGQSDLGFAPGKVHLFGLSAGSGWVMRWAMANPTLVQSITVLLPLVNIQDVYDRDPLGAGITASISAAYGGRPADAEVPAKNTGLFAGLPIKMYYSTNDPICTASLATTFGASVGATMVSMGAIGHAITGINRQSIADWLVAND